MAIAVSGWNIYSFIINWHHNLNPLLERQPTVDDKCITKIRCVLYLNMKKSCKEKGKWLPQLTGQMAHPARAFKTPWLTRVTKIYIRQPESKPPSHYNVCTYTDFWPHCPPGQDTSPIQGHPHFFRLFSINRLAPPVYIFLSGKRLHGSEVSCQRTHNSNHISFQAHKPLSQGMHQHLPSPPPPSNILRI